MAEGASVVGLAAVLAGKAGLDGPTATILTGRNLDMDMFTDVVSGRDVALGDRIVKGKTYGA